MELRRLSVESDRALYEETYVWDKGYPRWYQDLERLTRLEFEEFIRPSSNRIDVGVFDPGFVALVSAIQRAPTIFEGHIWAKREASVETLAWAVLNIRHGLQKDLGMTTAYVWIAKKNAPIKKLCMLAGLMPDGMELVDGESHGKPITWIRCSYGKEEDRNKTRADAELLQSEPVRLQDCA